MKSGRIFKGGSGIGAGAAIGLAVCFALGYESKNLPQVLGLGLSIGVTLGAILDFLNRKK